MHKFVQHIISEPHVNRNVFNKRLKKASVAFGMRTEYGRLVQADGPAMAKGRRPYVLSRCRGTYIYYCVCFMF